GENQCPTLRLRQTRQDNSRHGFHAKFARGKDTAVPGDQGAILGNQHRIGETELAHRASNLCNLRFRMRASIAGIWNQLIEAAVFDSKLTCAAINTDMCKFSDCHFPYPIKS